MDNSSFEPSTYSEIPESSSNQPSTSTCITSFEKLTMEEQNKRNNNKMALLNGQRLTLILAAIVGIVLLVSNIVLLVFTIRGATDVEDLTERVDRLHVTTTSLANEVKEQDINDRPLNLKLCTKGQPCRIVDKGPRQLCFKLSTQTASWFEAKEQCGSMGGYLAEVTDPDIYHFVKSITTEDTWLGGTDRLHEGQWMWDHSGAEFTFTDWTYLQPDNGGGTEHCLQIWWSNGRKWNDQQCTIKLFYLCEKANTDCEAW